MATPTDIEQFVNQFVIQPTSKVDSKQHDYSKTVKLEMCVRCEMVKGILRAVDPNSINWQLNGPADWEDLLNALKQIDDIIKCDELEVMRHGNN